MMRQEHTDHYGRLLAMVILHFIAMYAFMYAMVDVFGNVYHNLNQFYMAGVMTASMLVVELLVMGGMYQNKTRNGVIIAASIAALVGFFVLIRQQVAISDAQFLRSMIPHHGGAILMCEQAPIRDPEIRELCENIIAGQQAEIDQ